MSTDPIPQPETPKVNNWGKPWLRSAYSEKDGTGSFARFGTQEALLCCIACNIILALAAYRGPDARTQMILSAWPSIIYAMAAWCGTLYGLNQWGKPKNPSQGADSPKA